MSVLIIAEAGVNHNGSLDVARHLVETAAKSGADFVKFQTFKAARMILPQALKADYQIQNTDTNESQYQMLKRLELSTEMYEALLEYGKACGIGVFSTGFDIESIDLLCEYHPPFIKIASGEITNLPFLRHIGSLKKRIILSTGMSTLGEIESAIEALEQTGTQRSSITVLHCTTEYPTPMDEVNLRAMQSIQQAFGVTIGYSDHTSGIEVAIAAVALGATVIEKHFTLDRNLPGPDHKASLEPDELKMMITAIRNIEVALGNGIKRPTFSEARNKLVARKSIVASKAIGAGEIFSLENIVTKRPSTGISPMRWDEVIGKKASRDYVLDEFIEL